MSPEDLVTWRGAERRRLLALRESIPVEERRAQDERITASLLAAFTGVAATKLAMYWPMKGEFDPRVFALRMRERGARIALPVVVRRGAPLRFVEWWPGVPTAPGVFRLPSPQGTPDLVPDAVLVPPVGFDAGGYRLGYGGGYFDRTLAATRPRPVAIGVGREASRIDTIFPQRHDIPMDFIVTEAALHARVDGTLRPIEADAAAALASGLVEARRALTREELGELLNTLLAAERAGALALRECAAALPRRSLPGQALHRLQRDESRNCRVLLELLRANGIVPGVAVGDFVEKMRAVEGLGPRLSLLNRGQAWVARRIEAALPRIPDAAVREPLHDMMVSHAANMVACTELLESLAREAPASPQPRAATPSSAAR